MMSKETILFTTMWVVTVCTYVSYVPQIIKIIKTKSSEDLSIASWFLWTVSAICNTAYSVVLLRTELIIAAISELLLIIVTFVLSLIYKGQKSVTALGVELEYKDIYEYYLLQAIVRNYFANKDAVRTIAKQCSSKGVLLGIVQNKNIPEEIKEIANQRIADLKYGVKK